MRAVRRHRRPEVLVASPHSRTTPVGRFLPLLAVFCLLLGVPALARVPPADILKRIADNGSRFEQHRARCTYRQFFDFYEFNRRGTLSGSYREVRDVSFAPDGERTEEFVEGPSDALKRIRMTDEDFSDLRDVQPFALTNDTLWRYKATYRGRETMDGRECFVYRIKPRQVLAGQRMLAGQLCVEVETLQVIRAAGQPLPRRHTTSDANLFASFATEYAPIDGEFWFPVRAFADDYLPFPSGVQRVKYEIRFENYRRFSAEATIRFGEAEPATPQDWRAFVCD